MEKTLRRTISLPETTIGKKALLAVSGLVLYGFVIGHMLGNLQVFMGPEQINGYAAGLKANALLLWGVRGVLLLAVAVHAIIAIQLIAATSSARPVGYRAQQSISANYASKTMKYGGPALLLYIVFHLMHFTFPGLALSSNYTHSHTDVYANFVHAFNIPWVVLVYVTAQVFLGLHLYHGAWSLFQTLGMNHPRYNKQLRFVPPIIGVGVAVGNIAMPLAVFAGIVR
jgi:succinate dehydrogenase / fumarate reductase, cytochrome b subunit